MTQSIFQKILVRSQTYKLNWNYFFRINYIYSKNASNNSKCSICNKKIIEDLEDKENIQKKEEVCQECILKYSEEEIMIMVSLFIKYGGFFNQLNIQKPALENIIENLLDSLKNEEDFSRMIEINEKAFHQAILFGYRPNPFIEELKKI